MTALSIGDLRNVAELEWGVFLLLRNRTLHAEKMPELWRHFPKGHPVFWSPPILKFSPCGAPKMWICGGQKFLAPVEKKKIKKKRKEKRKPGAIISFWATKFPGQFPRAAPRQISRTPRGARRPPAKGYQVWKRWFPADSRHPARKTWSKSYVKTTLLENYV